jgi:tellurite methyltransferase
MGSCVQSSLVSDTEHAPFRWEDYFKATARKPAHATAERGMAALAEGFARMPAEVRVLDLGCGSGRDSMHFLSKGWKVIAVDSHPSALQELTQRALAARLESKLETVQEKFEKLPIDPSSYDLINASMALPFCEPSASRPLWERIRAGLRPSGIFAGHFFGKNDEWSTRPEMTFLWQSELESMLMGLELIHFAEHELDRETALGEMKHWHYFEVVARKH